MYDWMSCFRVRCLLVFFYLTKCQRLTSPTGVDGISDIAPESGKVQKVMQDLKC